MRGKIVAAALVCGLWGASAAAEDRDACGAGMICASDPTTVVKAMETAGLKAELTTDGEGDPMVSSTGSTYDFDVYFYGCEQHKHCDSLRFEAIFRKEPSNTLELANKWNAGKRFLQASVKPDGRMAFAYDVPTIGGVSARNFADVLDWWESMMKELAEFFRKEVPEETGGAKKS